MDQNLDVRFYICDTPTREELVAASPCDRWIADAPQLPYWSVDYPLQRYRSKLWDDYYLRANDLAIACAESYAAPPPPPTVDSLDVIVATDSPGVGGAASGPSEGTGVSLMLSFDAANAGHRNGNPLLNPCAVLDWQLFHKPLFYWQAEHLRKATYLCNATVGNGDVVLVENMNPVVDGKPSARFEGPTVYPRRYTFPEGITATYYLPGSCTLFYDASPRDFLNRVMPSTMVLNKIARVWAKPVKHSPIPVRPERVGAPPDDAPVEWKSGNITPVVRFDYRSPELADLGYTDGWVTSVAPFDPYQADFSKTYSPGSGVTVRYEPIYPYSMANMIGDAFSQLFATTLAGTNRFKSGRRTLVWKLLGFSYVMDFGLTYGSPTTGDFGNPWQNWNYPFDTPFAGVTLSQSVATANVMGDPMGLSLTMHIDLINLTEPQNLICKMTRIQAIQGFGAIADITLRNPFPKTLAFFFQTEYPSQYNYVKTLMPGETFDFCGPVNVWKSTETGYVDVIDYPTGGRVKRFSTSYVYVLNSSTPTGEGIVYAPPAGGSFPTDAFVTYSDGDPQKFGQVRYWEYPGGQTTFILEIPPAAEAVYRDNFYGAYEAIAFDTDEFSLGSPVYLTNPEGPFHWAMGEAAFRAYRIDYTIQGTGEPAHFYTTFYLTCAEAALLWGQTHTVPLADLSLLYVDGALPMTYTGVAVTRSTSGISSSALDAEFDTLAAALAATKLNGTYTATCPGYLNVMKFRPDFIVGGMFMPYIDFRFDVGNAIDLATYDVPVFIPISTVIG